MYASRVIVSVSGDGQCGKDLVAEWLSTHTDLSYYHSTSYAAAQHIFDEISSGKWEPKNGLWTPHDDTEWGKLQLKYNFDRHQYATKDDCYEDRRHHRQFWADWIGLKNKEDYNDIWLYREAVKQGNDILTGVRKDWEFQGCLDELIDFAIWIDRDGTPEDPTQLYGAEMCHMRIKNPVPFGEPSTEENRQKFYDKLKNTFSTLEQIVWAIVD